jgi:hypothetical protein
VSITAVPEPYVVEHPELPAEPPVMVQFTPAGLDKTLPDPPDPPEIINEKELGGGENLIVIVRAVLMVTWQASGFSVTGPSQPDHTAVPPPAGVAVTVKTMPAL